MTGPSESEPEVEDEAPRIIQVMPAERGWHVKWRDGSNALDRLTGWALTEWSNGRRDVFGLYVCFNTVQIVGFFDGEPDAGMQAEYVFIADD